MLYNRSLELHASDFFKGTASFYCICQSALSFQSSDSYEEKEQCVDDGIGIVEKVLWKCQEIDKIFY